MSRVLPFASKYVVVKGYEIHYTEWGAPDARVLIMWHGLARTGRDFDTAAAHFAARGYRVICPDTLGRGRSSWSTNPHVEYVFEYYAELAADMFAALGIESADWIGTSMGALIGMKAAAGRLKGKIRRLVMNDIGPVLNPVAVERIKAYVGAPVRVATMAELEKFFRGVYAPFGRLTDEEWRTMADTSYRRTDDGMLTVHYDPKIMEVFRAVIDGLNEWSAFDQVECPVLVLRGETSDLLLEDTLREMTQRGPRARTAVIPGCGHAPMLNEESQLRLLREFLADGARED